MKAALNNPSPESGLMPALLSEKAGTLPVKA